MCILECMCCSSIDLTFVVGQVPSYVSLWPWVISTEAPGRARAHTRAHTPDAVYWHCDRGKARLQRGNLSWKIPKHAVIKRQQSSAARSEAVTAERTCVVPKLSQRRYFTTCVNDTCSCHYINNKTTWLV